MKKMITLLLVVLFGLSLWFGTLSFTAAKLALTIWFEKLVPSVFVSMVCIRILYDQQVLHTLPLPFLPKLFHMDRNSFSLVLCTMFLGFPTGSIFIDEAYGRGEIEEKGAKRLLYTCSFATPGFMIMSCGLLFFHSIKIGVFLFFIQISSGLILLLFTRKTIVCGHSFYHRSPVLMKSISHAIVESGKSLYMIGGYLMFFMSLSSVVCSFLPDFASLPFRMLLEFSSGIVLLHTQTFSTPVLLCLNSFILSYAGFCVHMQVMAMLTHVHISYGKYLLYRLAQGGIAVCLCIIFLKLFLF